MSSEKKNPTVQEPIIDLTIVREDGNSNEQFYVNGVAGSNGGTTAHCFDVACDIPNGALVRWNFVQLDFARDWLEWPNKLEHALQEPPPKPDRPEKKKCHCCKQEIQET